ncbi:hypothetical protein TNCV_311731 [Trichonephila clavipes]|nr:hypothetical protein TNCV_311731 [Trichonephila clavipes]
MVPTSTQAEYLSMVQTSTQAERSFRKMAARLLHGRLFFHVPNFDQNRNSFQSRPLHRRSIHAEFKPLHRLNEVSKKWRSVSFTDAFVHCPDYGSKSKFYRSRPLHRRSIHAEFKSLHRLNEVSKKWWSVSFTDAFVHCPDFGSKSKFFRSRPSPHNLWETTRGPRRLSFFYFILKLNTN